MFTRCPQCNAVHALDATLLSHTRGLVQCGECERTFSALSFLFDDWPSGQAHGPSKEANAVPPVLRPAKKPPAKVPEIATDDSETKEPGTDPNQQAWKLATVLLLALTLANATWTFRTQLAQNATISTWLEQADESQAELDKLLKEPAKIQLISRDMHTHPTRSGILVLSLTFVNLAQRSQVFPELEVTLLDAANQPVAQRKLQPDDYLRPGTNTTKGLAADVYLPVLLELGDPGEQAVGFEIRFL